MLASTSSVSQHYSRCQWSAPANRSICLLGGKENWCSRRRRGSLLPPPKAHPHAEKRPCSAKKSSSINKAEDSDSSVNQATTDRAAAIASSSYFQLIAQPSIFTFDCQRQAIHLESGKWLTLVMHTKHCVLPFLMFCQRQSLKTFLGNR